MGSMAAGFTHRMLQTHFQSQLKVISPAVRSNTHVSTRSTRSTKSEQSERGVKWESLPLSEGEEGEEGVGGADRKDEEKEDKSLKAKLIKTLKILLPHVGLTALLLSYIAGGAAVFQWLETGTEMEKRLAKLKNITQVYGQIYNASFSLCQKSPLSYVDAKEELLPLLRLLSQKHEWDERFTGDDQLWNPHSENMTSRWTFPAAVLYALTVITTTGYDHITPLTNAGRLFAVFFGLIGIPLMFITAADIGKFLSEVVTNSYGKLLQIVRFTRRKLAKLCPSRASRARQDPTANGDLKKDGGTDSETAGNPMSDLDEPERIELPIIAYFLLILGYCGIGGFLFTRWESGQIWTFLHGFFFSFNTITTIGLGNILVRNGIYLILIVCYVIVGLAVITMCVDLASSQLKVFFTKLHYFGRKFRGARAFMNMSDDIKDAMKIIAALKKNRTSKGGITLEDIKQFLEIEQQYLSQPYVPQNIHFIRWVDDEEVSSARSGSLSRDPKVGSDPNLHI